MKPIEIYQEKFIELLKAAEEELGGGCLKVEVASNMYPTPSIYSSYPHPEPNKVKHYNCVISTNNKQEGILIG